MKFSIVVPIYKTEKYLKQCVDSILSQSFTDFELILVDDGSPDNSGKMCDDYAQKDCRVRVIHKQNGGLSDARNAGIKEAKGDYLCFLDSDDFWLTDKVLETFAEKMFATGWGFILPTIICAICITGTCYTLFSSSRNTKR